MNNKSVLVTGGLGYIGSHTVVDLMQNGYEVTIIDDLSNSYYTVLSNIEKIVNKSPKLVSLNLLNYKELESLFEQNRYDSVVHFAAHLFVDESVDYPIKYYKNNLLSLLNVLEAMDKFNVPNLIFSSSCTVYGNPEELPVTEATPIGIASSPYGTSKIMGETILKDLINSNSTVQAISLRYFNPVGAHHSGLIGETPKSEPKHLFPLIMEMVEKNKTVKVYGGDYNTKDGSPIRDYIHVEDVAEAHSCALRRLQNKENETQIESYNIGDGKGVSVLEIIKTFEKVLGKEIDYEIVGRRKGDVEKIYANPDLAKTKLNWKAKRGLTQMVESAVNWEKKKKTRDWK